MSYIYPHTDSKILKLGFGSMAGYREKKPEWKDGFFNVGLNERIKQWQEQSFIAYLKEPEFTEITYWKVKELYVIKQFNLREHTFIIGDILKTGSYFFQTLSKLFKEGDLSHYYPGQQEESFKYVKYNQRNLVKWQEVEEPEEMISHKKWRIFPPDSYEDKNEYEMIPNPKYTQFKEELKSGVILLEVITN